MSFGAIIGGGIALGGAALSSRNQKKQAEALPGQIAQAEEAKIQAFLRNAPHIFGTELAWAEPLADAAANAEISYKELMTEAEVKLRAQFGDEFIQQSLSDFDKVNPEWRNVKEGYLDEIKSNLGRTDQERLDARSELDPKGEALRGLSAEVVSDNFDLKDMKRAEGADELLSQTLSDLKLGGKLTPDVAREVEQATRRAQTARGGLYGNSSAFEEAMETGLAGERRREGRQEDAQRLLSSGLSYDSIIQNDNAQDATLALGYLGSGQASADTAYRDKYIDYAGAESALHAPSPSDDFGTLNAATSPHSGGYSAPNPSGMAYNSMQSGGAAALSAWNTQQNNNPWSTVLGGASKLGQGMMEASIGSRYGK